jgi:AraC-like DNA-binding protein
MYQLRPGDCAVYETTRPFRWLFDNAWDVWVFSLPADSVRLTEAQRRHLSARRLDATGTVRGARHRSLMPRIKDYIHQHLDDPALDPARIAAIAHARGFHDLSGFNRAFKAAYGVNPQDLRTPTTRA